MDSFSKLPDEYTPEDLEFFDGVIERFIQGEQIYGSNHAHVGWLLGYVIRNLLRNDGNVASWIEVGKTEQGVYIALFNLDDLLDDSAE